MHVLTLRSRKSLAGLFAMTTAASLSLASMPIAQRHEVEQRVSVIVTKLNPFDHHAEQVVTDLGGTVQDELPIVNGFTATVPSSSVPQIASVPGVTNVVRNGAIHFEGQ